MFLLDVPLLHPDSKCRPLLCGSSEMGNASDIQMIFDRIVTMVSMQMPISACWFDGDPSYAFCHNDLFI
jgi:hypothetical protein